MKAEDIGTAVRIYRAKNNLSQHEFGVRAGLSASAISVFENSLRNPTLSTLNALAKACKMSLLSFLRMVEKIRDEG